MAYDISYTILLYIMCGTVIYKERQRARGTSAPTSASLCAAG